MRRALRRYSYINGRMVGMHDVQAGKSYVPHYDCQGTVQCLTDETGAVTDRFAADALGNPVKRTGNSINRNWYIGQLGYYGDRDPLYVRARYYSPARAQWLSRDPVRGEPAYVYVRNRASLATDPSGRRSPVAPTGVGGLTGGVLGCVDCETISGGPCAWAALVGDLKKTYGLTVCCNGRAYGCFAYDVPLVPDVAFQFFNFEVTRKCTMVHEQNHVNRVHCPPHGYFGKVAKYTGVSNFLDECLAYTADLRYLVDPSSACSEGLNAKACNDALGCAILNSMQGWKENCLGAGHPTDRNDLPVLKLAIDATLRLLQEVVTGTFDRRNCPVTGGNGFDAGILIQEYNNLRQVLHL
jgi:RHS repeat-associated protein